MLVMMAAAKARVASLSQGRGATANTCLRMLLIAPLSVLNIPRQVRAVMYCGTAHGRMRRMRNRPLPGRGRLSSIASATPMTTWKATLITVHSTVMSSTA
jgi:hypothetical protein